MKQQKIFSETYSILFQLHFQPVMTNESTYIPSGHFFSFRYSAVVLGWTPFGVLLRCWKDSSAILVSINKTASHRCCRFVGRKAMISVFHSTTSHRCSIWLSSGDCGDHVSTVNPLLCSRRQFEIIWAAHSFIAVFANGVDIVSSTYVASGILSCKKLLKIFLISLHQHHHQLIQDKIDSWELSFSGYFLFFRTFCVISRSVCVGKSQWIRNITEVQVRHSFSFCFWPPVSQCYSTT